MSDQVVDAGTEELHRGLQGVFQRGKRPLEETPLSDDGGAGEVCAASAFGHRDHAGSRVHGILPYKVAAPQTEYEVK